MLKLSRFVTHKNRPFRRYELPSKVDAGAFWLPTPYQCPYCGGPVDALRSRNDRYFFGIACLRCPAPRSPKPPKAP